jgi:hypothetical protein
MGGIVVRNREPTEASQSGLAQATDDDRLAIDQ